MAAVCAALAASLVAMAARYADDIPAADETAARCEAMAHEALQLADRDAAAYAKFLAIRAAARRQSDQSGAEAVGLARRETADVPLQICELAAATAKLAAGLVVAGRSALVGDALTAAFLAEAVASSCAALVDIDLGDAPDDPRRAQIAALLSEAQHAVDGVRPHRQIADGH